MLSTLGTAREALRLREDISQARADHDVCSWSVGNEPPDLIRELPQWATGRGLEAVVWTGLGPRFGDRAGSVPTAEQVVEHLASLQGTVRDNAERYVRRAPRQVDTPYRRKIEAALHWTPLDPPR
jgi:hypothetical protein